VRAIFIADICETDLCANGGDLVINEPVAPRPCEDGAAHCYGGVRHDRLRCAGKHFTLAASQTVCNPASLDDDTAVPDR
jgi:hypothetical protein